MLADEMQARRECLLAEQGRVAERSNLRWAHRLY